MPPFQGLEILWTVDPGRRSPTRFALGYHLSGFQPLGPLHVLLTRQHPLLPSPCENEETFGSLRREL